MSGKFGNKQSVSYLEVKTPYAVEFSLMDQDEILKSSVVEIKNERIYEQGWLFPTLEGVNDPRMGIVDRDAICLTCKGSQVDCPGHFGHIELAKPMYHTGFLDYIRRIMKCLCFNCGKILYPRDKDEIEGIKRIKIGKHRFNQVLRACEKQSARICDLGTEGCGMRQPKILQKGLGMEVEYLTDGRNDSMSSYMEMLGYTAADKRQTIWPEEILRVLNHLTPDQQHFLGVRRPQNMILKRILVAPPPVRPAVSMGGPMKSEDDLTYAYQMILKANNYMSLQIQKGANQTTVNELRRNLQFYVATLMNNQIPGQPCQRHKSGKPLKALTQRLKGKGGRVRGNLMGKRVDFSARSVITPDPNLELDQLGVPIRIAENITVPVTCTPHNIDELRALINNGPARYPGAKYIIRHDDRQIDLSMLANRSDAHLEYGYIVERHLLNGDYVIFNRQPSLHKSSAMGHRVVVLPYSTFRLNLSVTQPYNADFDGDEMNMFVPQNYETMAEVKELMAVPYQIVSPQANRPVMGIVQDSLLGIMLLTRRDCFIDKATAMNLMMWIRDSSGNGLPMPAILKPKPLWTGKQLLSLVLPNVNLLKYLDASSKASQWCSPNDSVVVIQKGELISGYLNKQTAGSSQQGLVHIIWKECGPLAAKNFLSDAQCLINQWLVQHGFTVGVMDVIAGKNTMSKISERLEYYRQKVCKIIDKTERGQLKFQPGKNLMESFEVKVNMRLNQARDEAGQLAFKALDPQNKIQNMVSAGSKGTNINISQIMGCVGQQNVEGKRIPFGFKHRSLPHFTKYDFGPESKGFVKSNYQRGLEPAEFFFHAMGGREGLIDTAVKTSETGYIQRRLVKALEDVIVKYDCTVRNSADQVIQFLYGEDGMAGENIEDIKLDLLKMSNTELDQKFNFLPGKTNSIQHKELLKRCLEDQVIDEILEDPSKQLQLVSEAKQILKDRDELRTFIIKNHEDQIHLPVNVSRLIMNCEKEFNLRKHQVTSLSPNYVIDQVSKLVNELTVYPGRNETLLESSYLKEANLNSTVLFKIYLRQELASKRLVHQERMTKASFDWLIGEIKSRFEQSLVHPGETVGSIAAHSMGEPATQMTLNTFHFAGVSSKNVTLGVPRLKEVINVAKRIQTPVVSVYLQPKKRKSERCVMKLQGDIEHTTFADIIESSQIYYDPDPHKTVISEDLDLVNLYNEVPDQNSSDNMSPWVLRLKLDPKKVLSRTLDMNQINNKLVSTFQDQIHVMHSDINDRNLIFRLRFRDLRDDILEDDDNPNPEQDTAVMFLKQLEDGIVGDLTLKGIREISKVYAKKYTESDYDQETGASVISNDNWMLETDGCALQKILCVKRVDHRRTVSNDINEILTVLGIEAVRQSLINELRVVFNFYGIYVNYRHISTLVDVMCQKGRLTAITRHGINKLDAGPLRKCSFEETVDIFIEAAAYNEVDYLNGITESIMMGLTGPYGTGSFDMNIDHEVLREFAQTTVEEDLVAGDTPILEDFDEERNHMYTDYVQRTPEYIRFGQTSEYGRTPAGQSQYDAGFSPAPYPMSPGAYASPNAFMNSPGSPTYKASPVYGATAFGANRYQSPIYQANYASPIYQAVNEGVISPGNVSSPMNPMITSGYNQSPNYSPNAVTSAVNSPYQPDSQRGQYSPSYGQGGPKKQGHLSPVSSPSLLGNSPASPSYSPPPQSVILGSHHRSNTNSPAYSPSMPRNTNSSPNYSPTHMRYGSSGGVHYPAKPTYSPSYSPTTTPQFGQQHSPKYHISSRISPKYSISAGGSSDQHGRSSPKAGGTSHHDGGGSAQESSHDTLKVSSSVYIPSAVPKYNPGGPSSPAYNPSRSDYGSNSTHQPTYQGDTSRLYDPTRTTSSLKVVANTTSATYEVLSPAAPPQAPPSEHE